MQNFYDLILTLPNESMQDFHSGDHLTLTLIVGNGGFFRQSSTPSLTASEQTIVGARTKIAPPAASDTALLKSLTADLKKDLHLGGGGQDL